jgi:hypothetical protein
MYGEISSDLRYIPLRWPLDDDYTCLFEHTYAMTDLWIF